VTGQLLDAALAFCEAGCSVVPAATDGSKAPAVKWQLYQSRRPDTAQLQACLGNGTYDGFGLVCGAVSGGLEMLEFEGRAIAAKLHVKYAEALKDHGLLGLWQRVINGYTELTPGGGIHILYRVNGTARGNTKLAQRPATAAELTARPDEKVKVLIETRGEGGFTIVAPSGGRTHPSGKSWQIAAGGPATIVTITEAERDALHAVATLLDEQPPRQAYAAPAAGSAAGGRPGDDFNAKATWDEILAPHGWQCGRAFGTGRHGWRRPGKDGPGISATTRDDGGLYVFSTSAAPFDTEVPYSKFASFALLNHGGDYTAAARQLRRDGYGDQQPHGDENIEDLIGDTGTPRPQAGTKKEERRKPQAAPVPSPDPAMYTGVLGDITHAAAPSTEADLVGIYASLLAGAGVILGRDPHVQVGNTRHPLLIWPLLLGRTGSGRKGEATSTAEIFLRTAALRFDEYTVSGLSSGEGLIERISDDPNDDKHDKRLLVIESEFTSVMARSKREGSTLAAVQRQAWDGKALRVLNRKQLIASGSHIAIIGHITPQEFRLRLAESDMTGGTYNRYLPLFVERSRMLPIPEGVGEHIVRRLGNRLATAILTAADVKRISLGREATEVWTDELYREMTAADDEDQAHAEFTRRAAPYCLRIAGLLTALDNGRSVIGKNEIVAAGALVRYAIASARYVLDRQVRDPRLDRIRRAIDAAGDAGLTRSAISGLFSRNLTKEVLDELLALLTADGAYEECRIATRGRPAETYRRVVSSFFVPTEHGEPS
jgi:hypothetical protein